MSAARRAAYVRADSPAAHLLSGLALARLGRDRESARDLEIASRLSDGAVDPAFDDLASGLEAVLHHRRASRPALEGRPVDADPQ